MGINVLSEDLDLVPNTHMVAHSPVTSPRSDNLLGVLWLLNAHAIHKLIQAYKYTYKITNRQLYKNKTDQEEEER